MITEIDSLISHSMYRTDFQQWKVEPRKKLVPKPPRKSAERSKHRPVQMDLETMRPFRSDVNVPFGLLHWPKRIVQTNPHDPIPNVKLEDKMFELKLKARRERTTVYIVPQVSLDDVPEDVMYGENGKGGLASSLYSSNWKKACEFAVQNSYLKPSKEKVKASFEKKDIISKAIDKTRAQGGEMVMPMEIGLAKYLPSWDKLNPVEYVDTTKLFWEKNQNTGLCSVCDPQPAAKGLTDEEKTELESCLKEDVLRTPFTLHPPGYTGYVPKLALGIPFRKKKFSKYDQCVTTLMEAQGLYDAEKN